MGLTRTHLFTEKQNKIATMAKVMAHPARIAIIEHLLRANACINSDLVAELGLAQATISQHLNELKSVGIIQGTIEGTSMNYCINGKVWEEMKGSFEEFFACYDGKSCC
jgi:predicted transcriptional regulator